MGAGALELPTKKLHDLRVVDVRGIKDASAVNEILTLADDVWTNTNPVDWAATKPTTQLQELDRWLLSHMKSRVTIERLYFDLAKTLNDRLTVAEDRDVQTKQNIQIDIRTVAHGVAETVRPLLESIRFPESLTTSGALTEAVDFPSVGSLEIECRPMMDYAMLLVKSGRESNLLEGQYPRSVAPGCYQGIVDGKAEVYFSH